jgi:hypothetical protein
MIQYSNQTRNRLIGRRGFRVFLILFLLVIVGWHIAWFANYKSYEKTTTGYEKYPRQTMGKVVDGYNYTIKCPSYPQFVGNYVVSKKNLSVFLWPGLFNLGDYEIGVEVIDVEDNATFQLYVNEHLELDDKEYAEISEDERGKFARIITENKSELKELYKLATEEWAP